MTFKTQPHRYSIGLAPTSRARCRGCRQSIEKGMPRLAIHAFVRPNRGTTFAHHLTTDCVGAALARDVLRAHGVGRVQVDGKVATEEAEHAWALVGAKANGVDGRLGRCGKVDNEVGVPSQIVIGTMFSHFGRVEVGGGEEKEDT